MRSWVCCVALVIVVVLMNVRLLVQSSIAPPRQRFMFLRRLRLRPAIRRIRGINRGVATNPSSSPASDEDAFHLQQPQPQPQQQQRKRRRFFQKQRFADGSAFPSSAASTLVGDEEEDHLMDTTGIPQYFMPINPLPLSPLPPLLAPPPQGTPIQTLHEFHAAYELLKQKKARRVLSRLSVVGQTAEREHVQENHPVLHVIRERIRTGSKPGQREDNHKIGLAIEGGGMRGAVSAGAAAAVNLLGLSDAFDAVYGSSAGALIAAFFISRQLNGTIIYSDIIPRAGKRFLDRSQLLNAMGLLPMGESRPVLNLEFLLDVVRNTVGLDWEKFKEYDSVQPLNIITSSLTSMRSVALKREHGHFGCLDSLLLALKSSMCVPGVAGPPIRLNVTCEVTAEAKEETFADALIFEPIPMRSAVEDECTHIVTLRTRPDGSEVLSHKVTGIYERMIAKRFLADINKFKDAATYMTQFEHLRQYATDLLLLNEGSHGHQDGVAVPNGKGGSRAVHLLPVAPPEGTSEVATLDSSKEGLRKGLKDGFTAAWDMLGPPELVKEYPGSVIASQLFDCDDEVHFDAVWTSMNAQFGAEGGGVVMAAAAGVGGGGGGPATAQA